MMSWLDLGGVGVCSRKENRYLGRYKVAHCEEGGHQGQRALHICFGRMLTRNRKLS